MASIHDGKDFVSQPLDQMISIVVDENGIWHRPEYLRFKQDLAAPKPFLVPSFDDEVVEVLPSEKQNRKISFDEDVYVMEIENRFQLMEPEEMEDDDSYEIEIVEGSGAGAAGGEDDADFYLEMIDGEIFYVFETEDDISVEDGEYYSDGSSDSSDDASSDSDTQTTGDGRSVTPMQLNIDDMMAPNLDMEESCTNLDVKIMDDEDDNDLSSQIECSPFAKDVSVVTTPQAVLDEVETPTSSEVVRGYAVTSTRNPSSSDPSSPVSSKTDSASPPDSPPPSQGAFVGVDTPPISPLRTTSGITSPITPRSILKVFPPSPTKSKKKDKKNRKEKKEKTFTKTFVRATDFDGEHRVYNWEKPTWTNQQLKSTGKGDDIRKGGNLAQPITDAAQLIQKGQVKWEKPEWALQNSESELDADVDAREELIRKIQDGSMNLPGLQHNKRRLKLSINGSLLAAGADIVKPITKATIIKKPANINFLANPKILRATPGGSALWKGESLAGPVTQATTIKKYNWEKPSWVKAKLHATGVGEKLKSGDDVAEPVVTKSNIEWEKPDWATKRGIGRTTSARGGETKREYTWEKPSWAKGRHGATVEGEIEEERGALKSTEKGNKARNGENLSLPITQLPHLLATELSRRSEGPLEKPRNIRRTMSDDR